MIIFLKKHPRSISLLLLGLAVFIWIKSQSKDIAAQRTIASLNQYREENILNVDSSTSKLSLKSNTITEDEDQKPDEKKKKIAAYFIKLDECVQIEDDFKRAEKDNFTNKVNVALSSEIGDWFYSRQKPPSDKESISQTDRLFRAIALSGIAKKSEYFNYQEDLEASIKLADDVIEKDPTNSAGYLLKARLLDQQNRTDEAKKVLDLAEEKTDHFDTCMLTLRQKMMRLTKNATEMLVGNDLQIPLLLASSIIIKVIIKYKKVKLGEQIMKPANDNSKLLEEIEWSGWDYQAAKYALEKITNKKYPDHLDIGYKKNKILSQEFPEFDPDKQLNKSKDNDDYYLECENFAKLETTLDLFKRAMARKTTQ